MDEFLKLIDYFIKLVEFRNNRKDKYYREIVVICYESAKVVRDDFISIFRASNLLLNERVSITTAVDELMFRRATGLSLRDSLRSKINAVDESDFTLFELGLKSLLVGVHGHELLSNVRYLQHLAHRVSLSTSDDEIENIYKHALTVNDSSIELVENYWRRINSGYEEYLKAYLKR